MRFAVIALPLALLAASSCSSEDAALAPGADAGHESADSGWNASHPAEPDGGTTHDAGTGAHPDAEAPVDGAAPVDAASNRTTLRVHYQGHEGAMSLRGSGGPLSWTASVPFVETAPGVFEWSSEDLVGDLEWKPMLDSTWSIGPNYQITAGTTVDIAPHFFETHGTVARQWPTFTSTELPSTRGIWVYLPPTYVENTAAAFDVLYMHDGQNLFSSATAFGGNEWKVDETMDQGSLDGTIREEIVVGVENGGDARIDELTPSVDAGRARGGKAEQYLAMIQNEIVPLVNGTFRTQTGRDHTGLMGSSLGGLNSVWAGVHHADTFGLIGAMSPSTWWDDTMILGQVNALPAVRPTRVYVDSGNAGDIQDDFQNTATLAGEFRTLGYTDHVTLEYVLQDGGMHNEIYWAQRLPHALSFLLGPR